MQLFFNENLNDESTEITFTKEESRHITKVLRKKEEDFLNITNGNGLLFSAQINFATEKKCTATITSIEKKEKERNYKLHIAIAPTKNNDRLEWFLEKATEIGVDEITPILCQNSERKVIKIERLEKIVLSAMKQSLKLHKPKINPLTKFNDFIDQKFTGDLFIAHCEKDTKKSLNSIQTHGDYTICIGPEGDFSKKEIEKALNVMTPISLGKSRLRTETAGLVAVQSIYLINQQYEELN